MANIEAKLADRGLVLPEPMKAPPGVRLPFAWVRVRGTRAFISGHVPLEPNGRVARPLGRVGAEVSVEDGYRAAQLVALAQPRTAIPT